MVHNIKKTQTTKVYNHGSSWKNENERMMKMSVEKEDCQTSSEENSISKRHFYDLSHKKGVQNV